MSAREYRRLFLAMLRRIRRAGVHAPTYVAVATLCANADHPFQNRAAIREAQGTLPSTRRGIFAGPDTDRIGLEHRKDRCHFSASGLDLHAQAWFDVLTRTAVREGVSLAERVITWLTPAGAGP